MRARTKLTIACGLLVLGSCGRSQPEIAEIEPVRDEPTPAVVEPPKTIVEPDRAEPTSTLGDELRSRSSLSVLLAASDTRLLATDGEHEWTLVDAPIQAASYDPEHQLIWYVSGSQLLALDLLTPRGDPRVIADVLPADVSVALPDAKTWLGDMRVPEYLVLEWVPAPKLELGLSFGEVMNEDIAKAIEKARLVDTSWLEALASREARSVPAAARARKIADAPLGDCWAEESCGRGVAWPNSGWKLYLSEYDCGDYCYTGCTLWDSKGKRTASPDTLPSPSWESTDPFGPSRRVAPRRLPPLRDPPAAGSCGPFYTDASGTAVTVSRQLCRGDRCSKVPGRALGFIDPGPTIEVHP